MTPAPKPDNETDRLRSLQALAVLDTAAEPEFDALVQAASALCGTPISLVSLVDAERQWFKANHGLEGATQTPRDVAFCAHAILDDRLFEVPDAWDDARFADNPLVAGAPDIRFYAGAPVRLSDGHRVGTLCVIDRRPRQLDDSQRQVLMRLSQAVARALEGRSATQRLQDVVTELAQQRTLLETTLRAIQDAVVTADGDGRIRWANPAAEALLGRPAPRLQGRLLARAMPLRSTGRRGSMAAVHAAVAAGQAAALPQDAVLRRGRDDEIAVAGEASALLQQGQVCGAVWLLRDVSAERRAAHEMAHRASHDALTGLVNRAEFEARLRQLIDAGTPGALMVLDLDHFKIVNDSCGHSAGDEVLRQVARQLHDAVRASDTVARLGGDEFGILLPQCPMSAAAQTGQRICDRLEAYRFVQGEQRFRIGASIGLVPIGGALRDAQTVLQAADSCAYRAKDGGRNRVVTWRQHGPDAAGSAEASWAARVERALDEDRLVLFGQRVVPLRPGHGVSKVEVLLRLRQDDGSLVAPGAFLPAAERYHLMGRIDRWVVRRTLAWMAQAPFTGEVQRVGLNLSGQSIADPVFCTWLLETLAAAGSQTCARLTVEITETVAITRLDEAADFVRSLQRTGVRVALDDFGSGAAGFGYLKSLPVNYLKIDGRFIRDLLVNPLDLAAVKCFVEVARAVGVKTVAEFVERADVLQRLRELGVDFAQGYLLHRPEPLEQAAAPSGATREPGAAVAERLAPAT